MTDASRQLKIERDRFVAFAFATAHLLLETDANGTVRFAAGAACGLSAKGAEDLSGRVLTDIAAPEDRAFLATVLGRIAERGSAGPVRLSLRNIHGQNLSFFLGGRTMPATPDTLFLSLTLAPARIEQNDVRPDGLQGSKGFTETATAHMQLARQTGLDEGLTLFVVDGLAQLAAARGPEAVHPVAARIAAFLRAVSAGGEAAGDLGDGRYGLVRAPGVSEGEIRAGIQAILDEAAVEGEARCFSLSFDAGGLDEADAARALAYSIKRFADAAPETFSIQSLRDGAQALVGETVTLVRQARTVLEQRQVDIVYQPIVQMEHGRVHHLEALTRISGVSSIGEWMRFAEESGLIQDIDLAVTGKVLETLEGHEKAGWRPLVAVNLSARSLQSPLFIDRLLKLMGEHLVASAQLMIEVTETAAVVDFDQMAVVLEAFQRRGNKICLDDVGAGSSSLQTLRALPCDFVKLDGSMVRRALHEPRELAALKAIAAMAADLGWATIAEQIETRSQASVVRQIGCRFGQGFLFGRPTADCTIWRDRMAVAEIVDPMWVPIPASDQLGG